MTASNGNNGTSLIPVVKEPCVADFIKQQILEKEQEQIFLKEKIREQQIRKERIREQKDRNALARLDSIIEQVEIDQMVDEIQRGVRLDEALIGRFHEKFPGKKKFQMPWVLRQLETVKDLILDEIRRPRNISMDDVKNYATVIIKIRETILLRDRQQGHMKSPEEKLDALLTPEQEEQIAKTLRGNGRYNGTDDRGTDQENSPRVPGQTPR